MKKVALIGVVLLLVVAGISLVAAFNFGETSKPHAAGLIQVDPSVDDKAQYAKTLFLVVFGSDMPMPYGAMKIRLDEPLSSSHPLNFRITKERLQLMNENRPLPRELRIKARLDRDGIAGPDQPGDMTGEISGVYPGATDLTILINRYVEAP